MAGIYIPNMGMPQRDEVITIYPDGTAHRHHLGLRLHISESKAIPVPEHGDLIDRDELRKQEWVIDGMVHYFEPISIEEAPAIIPADKEEQI